MSDEYINNRLDEQIKWYDEKSQKHQKHYKILKTLEIILVAIIPVITIVININSKWIITSLASAILIFQAINQLNKNHENYIEYRSTCEALKHEKMLFLYKSGVYSNEESDTARFSLLVNRAETIISNENINWSTMQYDEVNKKGE